MQAVPLHVEVSVPQTSILETEAVRTEVLKILTEGIPILRPGPVDLGNSHLLSSNGVSVEIVDMPEGSSPAAWWQVDPHVHVFRLNEDEPEVECIDGVGNEEGIGVCDICQLPNSRFQGLWDSLVIDDASKSSLIEMGMTSILFSDKKVSPHLVSFNRCIFLHGPPGTGKTSLCKALAHKLSIRLAQRFPTGQFLEINSHSLFSKWFSESGKIVGKLFDTIGELADDEDCLVCILIDEVESLAAARSASSMGNEPSDAIRVVNALLTQIDKLRHRNNVLLLATSNISQSIDVAFIDRADLKLKIGLPGPYARYKILKSCTQELMRAGIISPWESFQDLDPDSPSFITTVSHAAAICGGPDTCCSECGRRMEGARRKNGEIIPRDAVFVDSIENGERSPSTDLAKVAVLCEGFSGRALRKLPFQAHACYIQQPQCTLATFLAGIADMAEKELKNREDMLR